MNSSTTRTTHYANRESLLPTKHDETRPYALDVNAHRTTLYIATYIYAQFVYGVDFSLQPSVPPDPQRENALVDALPSPRKAQDSSGHSLEHAALRERVRTDRRH